MMKEPSRMVQSIFEIHANIETVFFREFMHNYDLPKGINSTHMKTMLMISSKNSSTMSDVSKRLTLEKGSFTPVANRLIKLGFVEKNRSDHDKRVYTLSLTESGRKVTNDFKEAHFAYLDDLLGTLDGDEEETLVQQIEEITTLIRKISKTELPSFL